MKKLLFVLMACVLSIGLIGGAFAYFTDVETSTGNTFTAGTLNIEIAQGAGGFSNDPVVAGFNSPAGLAPGQSWNSIPIYIKNVGSIDIQRIYARFGDLVETNGLDPDPEGTGTVYNISTKIKLLWYAENLDGGAWIYQSFVGPFTAGDGSVITNDPNAYLDYWQNRGAPAGTFDTDAGFITVRDLVEARNWGSGDRITSLCLLDGSQVIPPIPNGHVVGFKFGFQLMSDTNNIYQGDTCSFVVNFIAAQLSAYPDDSLGESVTEPLAD